jgi:hypothetical protein
MLRQALVHPTAVIGLVVLLQCDQTQRRTDVVCAQCFSDRLEASRISLALLDAAHVHRAHHNIDTAALD